ncbi:EAL domain-containing protein [Neptunomonas phycophila]|uniref:EAL domain-containing protein n=1 Tax=Neptunomonas phycophila TaxID=1572645 RepID=A0ABT9EUM8_9GAMM|nr:EAL domain-containing protein [Neptunomonas phycophila]MDP2522706.1 EAL domain-containing protein [Neptunomonas phycophila]
MRPFFVSVRWKILLPLLVSLLITHISIFWYADYSLVSQYESARHELNTRNLKALDGSLTTSYLKQLELAQTIALVVDQEPGSSHLSLVQKMMDRRFPYFESMGMLENAALYTTQGKMLFRWGDVDYKLDNLVGSALQYEYPVRQLQCVKLCRRQLAIPLLNEGHVSGVLVVGRAIHDMVVDFKQLTGVDIGVAKFSQDNWQDVSAWSMDFSQLTQRNRNLQVLNALSEKEPDFHFDELYQLEAFDQKYEVFLTSPGRFDSDDSIWVLIADATERFDALETYRRILGVSLLISFLGLSIVAYVLSVRVRQRALAIQEVGSGVYQGEQNEMFADEFNLATASLADLKLQVSQLSSEERVLDDRLEKALHALNLERELISALFDTSKSILLIQNMDGMILSGNACAESIFGSRINDQELAFSSLFSDDPLSRQAEDSLQRLYMGLQRMSRFDTKSHDEHGSLHYLTWINTAIDTSHDVSIVVSLAIDVTDKKKAEERLAWLAFTDPVSALENRDMFLDKLPQAMDKVVQDGRILAMLCLDIDDFETLQKQYNHVDQETLLNGVTSRIHSCLRDDDMLARFSDDLYMIVLRGMKDHKNAELVAQKLIQAFKEPFLVNEETIYLAINIGVSYFPDHADDVAGFVNAAESAMFLSRQSSKNHYLVFSPGVEERLQTPELETLTSVLQRGLLDVSYQPVIDMRNGRVLGATAGLCWKEATPSGDERLRTFYEDTSNHSRMNEFLINESLSHFSEWRFDHHRALQLFLPVRVRSSQVNELFEQIQTALVQYKTLMGLVVIEFQSDDVLRAEAGSEDLMQRLKDLGVQVAINTNDKVRPALYLAHTLPHDYIKLPIHAMLDSDEENKALIKSVVRISKELQIDCIAHGIQTADQTARLLNGGCAFGVGRYYASPMRESEFIGFIENVEMLEWPKS